MRRHFIRVAAIWVAVSIALEILIAVAPIPIPTGSPEATGARRTMYLLLYIGTPIFAFVCVLLAYSLITFRARKGAEEEPGVAPDSTPILLLWISASFFTVMFLAAWGTFSLHEIAAPPHPSSAGESTSQRQPRGSAAARPLVIQVIARQWLWTFRYPSYGGMVTRDLVVPYDVPVALHITSIDVVHSLWIYDYDIKQDAVPGVDNTVWFLASTYENSTVPGTFAVRCNELCGIGHSYMHTGLDVMTQRAFARWARARERLERSSHLLERLPKFSAVYYPALPSDWPVPPESPSP
jgi:cytochrome c oxidase subunit 2